MIDDTLKGMPEGFSLPRRSLLRDTNDVWQGKTFMSRRDNMLIELGDKMSEEFEDHLNDVIRKRRVKDIETLFDEHVDPPPEIEKLTEELKQETFVEQISQDDQVWDEAMATAFNAFQTSNVDSLSRVQKAIANWKLAVRKYRSESRNAWRTFNAGLKKPSIDRMKSSENCNDVYQEVKYFKRSSEVSEILLNYEQARAQATSELATAFGELVNELHGGGTDAAVGEATLIQAEQTASETFWTSVQTALDNPSE